MDKGEFIKKLDMYSDDTKIVIQEKTNTTNIHHVYLADFNVFYDEEKQTLILKIK